MDNYSILNENIEISTITNFAKRYLTAITKTTRLLNIIDDNSFSKKIKEAINEKYIIFSSKNKDNLDLLSNNSIIGPLENKMILDYKKNKIYNI